MTHPISSRAPRRLRRALAFVRPMRAALGLILGLSLAAAAVSSIEPLILKRIFDDLEAGAGVSALGGGIALFAVLLVVHEALGALGNWLTWRTRLRLHFSLLERSVDRLHRLPISYHQREGVGAVMTRLDRGIQGFLGAFSQLAFQVLPSVVYLGLSVYFMFHLDWRLALVVLIASPLPVIIAGIAGPVQSRRERRLLDRWALIYSRFNEVLGGIAVVKSFAREHEEQQRFLDDVSDANRIVERGVGFDTAVRSLQSLVVALARASALGVGGYLVVTGEVTAGTLVAFLGYVAGLFGPVQGLLGAYETVQKATASFDTILGLLDEPEVIRDAPDAVELESARGEVTFEGVRFAYPEGEEVIGGLDLHIEPGETVALVGPSGSGKTTVASLLQRFWDPASGRIRIDGIDLRHVTQQSLRRQIGVVHQDPLLFRDTIAANIAYGRPDACAERIAEAARAANAHEFIMRLPDGYQTEVGERGGRLSGGQRQRLAIARALLKDPPILILDEATSALDVASEALVQQALERLAQGRTTLVIAHRLSTVRAADRIVVLRDGKVAEVGSHDELVRQGGDYAEMVRVQLGARR